MQLMKMCGYLQNGYVGSNKNEFSEKLRDLCDSIPMGIEYICFDNNNRRIIVEHIKDKAIELMHYLSEQRNYPIEIRKN